MKVTFQIEGATPVVMECNLGDNLLELARRGNVAIDAPCSGNGSCGKCRVKLVEGQLDSLKSRHISDEEWESGWRLSCNSKVLSDCTVFVPDIASAYQSRMKTADLSSPKEIAIFEDCQAQLKESGIHFVNNFRSVVVTMAEPTLDDTMPDNERLTWAVQEALGVDKVHIPYTVMVRMAHVLRENNWTVCVKGEVVGDTFRCMEICGPEDTAIDFHVVKTPLGGVVITVDMDGGIAQLECTFQYFAAPGVNPDIFRFRVVGVHAAQRGQAQTAVALHFGYHTAQGVGVSGQQQGVILVFTTQVYKDTALGGDGSGETQHLKTALQPQGCIVGVAAGRVNGKQLLRLLPGKVCVRFGDHSDTSVKYFPYHSTFEKF